MPPEPKNCCKDNNGSYNVVEICKSVMVSENTRRYFVERERVLSLRDGEHLLSAPEDSALRLAGAWLIVPLVSNGKIEGLAVLREQIVPERLIYEDYDLMKDRKSTRLNSSHH